ncbi:MAG: DUF4405 domain-containing protein [Thermoguttaceae bacterium]|nr:DUF4405 domain-containing protein [Thermoguttaceae bacterium]
MNSKTKTNYYVDLLLFITMVIAMITGVILWGWTRPVGQTGTCSTPQAKAVSTEADAAVQNAQAQTQTVADAAQAESNNGAENAQAGRGNAGLGQGKGRGGGGRGSGRGSGGGGGGGCGGSGGDGDCGGSGGGGGCGGGGSGGCGGGGCGGGGSGGCGGGGQQGRPMQIFWGLMEGNTLLGMSKGEWKTIHCWNSFILFTLMIVHIVLHWRWVVCTTKKLCKSNDKTDCENVVKICEDAPKEAENAEPSPE